MSKYYVGFKFRDILWGEGDEGEIVGQRGDRWEVLWASGAPARSFETDGMIDEMISGETH